MTDRLGTVLEVQELHKAFQSHVLDQCFSTAGPRPGTGPWHHLYRAARDSPEIDN